MWVVRYPVCRRCFIYGRVQNLVRINKRQQGQQRQQGQPLLVCTLANAFACVISIAYKKVVLVVYVVSVVVYNLSAWEIDTTTCCGNDKYLRQQGQQRQQGQRY